MLDRLREKYTTGGIALLVILLAVTISIIAYVMANGNNPVGPSPETDATSIICEDELTPVVSTCTSINVGVMLQGVDSGSGRFTLNVITPTPQPTPTPGAGGGFPFDVGRPSFGGTEQFMKPGIDFQAIGNRSTVDDTLYYEPFFVFDTIGVDSLTIELISGSGGSETCRLGIYESDIDWQPVALVVDAGTVLQTTGGVKTATFTEESLAPGRYLTALICEGVVNLRVREGDFVSGIAPAGTGNQILAERTLASQNTQLVSGFSDPGSDWTAAAYNNTGSWNYVVMNIATP